MGFPPALRRALRYAYLAAMALFVAGVLAQAYFAGQFLLGGGTSDRHVGLGWPLAHLLAPLAFLLSLGVGGGRGFLLASVAWGLLAVVLPILAAMAQDGPNAVAALHPVVALLVFSLSLWLLWRAWRLARSPPPAQAPSG